MPAVELGQLIGRNARRLRLDAGITLDALSQASRRYGTSWTTTRISEIERGTYTPQLPTLLTLAHILSTLSGRPVTLADLLDGDEDVPLTDTITLPATTVRGFFQGAPVALPDTAEPDLGARTNLSDQWAAKKLGIDIAFVTNLSVQLWGGTFSEERDRRAGPDATRQRKGQYTRELVRELARHLPPRETDSE